jgi:hypothetical protein
MAVASGMEELLEKKITDKFLKKKGKPLDRSNCRVR